jgi:hypothetical protein
MPRLPDFTALGQRDTGPSRRPIATIDTSAESNAIAGFGRSISGAADTVFRAAMNDKSQDLQINGARADADFLTKKIEFEKQFNDEDQDYANWSPRYQEGIKKIADGAAAQIADPRARELWTIRRQDDIARGTAGIEQKAKRRDNDNYYATGIQSLEDLKRTFVEAQDDEQMRVQAIKAGQGVVEDMRRRGIISDTQAAEFGKKWVENAAEAVIANLSPEDRIDALRGRVTGIAGVVDRIIGVESGGNPNARAATSSATGLGQFISSTWLDMVRRHRPELMQGRSPAEVLAMRTDPQLSREMTTRYVEENAAKLQAAGVEATPRNIYLAHFLGPGAAPAIAKADPNDPVSKYVPAAAIAANKSVLQGKTVGQVQAWAERKMGGAGSRADLAESIPQERRRVLLERASGEVAEGQRQQAVADEANRKAWVDQIQFRASKGDYTIAEADQAFMNGQFRSFEEYNGVKSQIMKFREDGDAIDSVVSILQDPNGLFNPRDKGQRAGLDALDERTGLTDALAKNDPEASARAAQLFGRTGYVTDRQKGYFESAIRSGNPQQLEFAMSTLDRMYRTNQTAFRDAFSADTFTALQDWQNNVDRDPKLFWEELRKARDPANIKAREALEKQGREVVKKMDDNEILKVFDDSWMPFNDPDAPITTKDFPGMGILRNEYEDLYARGFRDTRDEKKAKEFADRYIRETWGVSASGGGRLMKYAPESLTGILPHFGGDPGWMEKQVQSFIRGKLSIPEQGMKDGLPVASLSALRMPRYALVPQIDGQTKAEIDAIKAGAPNIKSPSWVLVYEDLDTAELKTMGTFRFDPDKAREEYQAPLRAKRQAEDTMIEDRRQQMNSLEPRGQFNRMGRDMPPVTERGVTRASELDWQDQLDGTEIRRVQRQMRRNKDR